MDIHGCLRYMGMTTMPADSWHQSCTLHCCVANGRVRKKLFEYARGKRLIMCLTNLITKHRGGCRQTLDVTSANTLFWLVKEPT